jgi:hypothetical protein
MKGVEPRTVTVADDISLWRAEVTVRVGYETSGPLLLPPDEAVTLGRDEGAGLRTDHPAVSRELARFAPTARGWVLENGRRTRVRLESPFVVAAMFAPQAHVLLQPADWTLVWDLDVLTEVAVRYRRSGHGEPYPTACDADNAVDVERAPQRVIGTDLAGDHLNLTGIQRRRLGALFAYLIEGRPKPEQLIQTASKLSGDSIPQINGTWVRVMEYVNRHRDVPIERIEDLGYHLVEVAGIIGPDDLPEQHG